jgi:16S rRNA (guanine1207-N2)-methyltransferase
MDQQPQHYFSAQPEAESRPRQIEWTLPEGQLRLWVDQAVFAGRRVDRGTDLLARSVDLAGAREVLDLGAGYGPLGLAAALRYPETRVTLVEINERAAALAARNVELNGLSNVEVITGDAPLVLGERSFDAVLSNPPLRAGNEALWRLFTDAAARLTPGGSLWLVIQTKQGAKTWQRDLATLFSEVHTAEVKGGFRVLRAVKSSDPGA